MMQLGLVTYMWGAEWDLPTVIKNCQATGFAGVELRSGHKHGVEPSLGADDRRRVADAFRESGIELVGFGTACEYHSPDRATLLKNIDQTKDFIVLAHDCGATGVKVRPNGLPKEVPVPKTLEQIGNALDELAAFGEGYGVVLRLEVHGAGTDNLEHIHKIMQVADHPGATVCWNCNPADLAGQGLEANFGLVRDRIGTVHIHDLISEYPWQTLFHLLNAAGFAGWTLLEEGAPTADPLRVMKYYRLLWEKMTRTDAE
ncbi:MAG TPA: sugar phosphate isomerase/epimerase family protein [Pirellulales bacterium]|nr:sugar phosphate isomerase/epimerase family protein [Pirellulales bacterium]